MSLDTVELQAFLDTARRFARREVQPLVGTEGRDGDLAGVSDLLGQATDVGLAAGADPEDAGFDHGVWGRACLEDGPGASLEILREIARECAGVAACVHLTGMGALELNGAGKPPAARPAVALLPADLRLELGSLGRPPGAVSLTPKKQALSLSGRLGFVACAPGTDGFVVYAAREGEWARVVLPRNTAGLTVEATGHRTGLSAMELVHLQLDDVKVKKGWILEPTTPESALSRHLLGLAAIAVGNAEGAIAAARLYAAERYQGGAQIEAHPAVRLLLGESASRIEVGRAVLRSLRTEAVVGLPSAAAIKLRLGQEGFQAVTDCLQVFGGYGYMEEYRMEKRLRDALTLKSLGPRADDLRLLCGDAVREEAS